MITAKLLEQMGVAPPVAEQFAPSLARYAMQYDINTPLRQIHFLTQILHESGRLSRLEENLNYSAEGLRKTWPGRFKTQKLADTYARNPKRIANYVYANRLGNGNEASGDGWRYRGRGPIQCTGRGNYKQLSDHIGIDYVDKPGLLIEPEHGSQAACWFWQQKAINLFADADNLIKVTKLVNGGAIGLTERQALLEKAKSFLVAA